MTDQENGLDHGVKLAAVLCLLLGCVIIVASIFGTVALFKECKRMLISVRERMAEMQGSVLIGTNLLIR